MLLEALDQSRKVEDGRQCLIWLIIRSVKSYVLHGWEWGVLYSGSGNFPQQNSPKFLAGFLMAQWATMPCFHHPDEIRILRSFSVRGEELGVGCSYSTIE